VSIYQRIADIQAAGDRAALATVTRTTGSVPRRAGAKMLVLPDGAIEGSIGGGEMEGRVIEEALAAMTDGRPRTLQYELRDPSSGDPGVCGGTVEVYVEVIRPEETVVVVGAGHVGQAVAHLADWLGFRVEVSDDRPEFCTPDVVPSAQAFHPGPLDQLPASLTISDHTYLVLTTRNLQVDLQGLPALLDSPAAYIGVIGSRRRWATARKKLAVQGIPAEKLERVRSPMGLELNAETPEEIAVSILSEIIMLRRGGDGDAMSET
jgi:xanthine dehydrogenase accessory factor